MVESDLHGFLKKVGAAFLINQGCFLVDTEVPLTRFGQRRMGELDGAVDAYRDRDAALPAQNAPVSPRQPRTKAVQHE